MTRPTPQERELAQRALDIIAVECDGATSVEVNDPEAAALCVLAEYALATLALAERPPHGADCICVRCEDAASERPSLGDWARMPPTEYPPGRE